MSWKCRLGLHKYDKREIHAAEPIKAGQTVMQMNVIVRCRCGEGRLIGREMPTSFYVSEKYKYKESSA